MGTTCITAFKNYWKQVIETLKVMRIENSLTRGKDCKCNLTEHTRLTAYNHQYIQQKCKMNYSLKMCLLYHTLHTEEKNNDWIQLPKHLGLCIKDTIVIIYCNPYCHLIFQGFPNFFPRREAQYCSWVKLVSWILMCPCRWIKKYNDITFNTVITLHLSKTLVKLYRGFYHILI